MASDLLLKALITTAELMGKELSVDAARVFCADLEDYAEPLVLAALARCRREVRGPLTVAEVIARIDDGRPGPNEAWAMIPPTEDHTVVWTDEMAGAWAAARSLLEAGDPIAARMAFIETYQREVTRARAERRLPRWWVSAGHDSTLRDAVVRAALDKGRLTQEQATRYLSREATELLSGPENGHRSITEIITQAGIDRRQSERRRDAT